jgi:hypothetical protein
MLPTITSSARNVPTSLNGHCIRISQQETDISRTERFVSAGVIAATMAEQTKVPSPQNRRNQLPKKNLQNPQPQNRPSWQEQVDSPIADGISTSSAILALRPGKSSLIRAGITPRGWHQCDGATRRFHHLLNTASIGGNRQQSFPDVPATAE